MTIGLKRGVVKLSPYCSNWPLAYEQERLALLGLAGDCIAKIEHIGSTSVPGLMAKPVIDIGIEVDSMQALEVLIQRIPKGAYEYFGLRDIPDDYFFAKGPEALRTHYIHVSLKESGRLKNYVKFRDALRQRPELAEEYLQLKHKLAAMHSSDRKVYTKLKGELVARVVGTDEYS